jgi:hypothetical protein
MTDKKSKRVQKQNRKRENKTAWVAAISGLIAALAALISAVATLVMALK